MSDVLSDTEMYSAEPDETVLTAALRNKDDIPILMDIVGEASAPVSQEQHFVQSFTNDKSQQPDAAEEPALEAGATATPVTDSKAESTAKASLDIDSERLSAAIEAVLQRKLPEIVQEVVLELSKNETA